MLTAQRGARRRGARRPVFPFSRHHRAPRAISVGLIALALAAGVTEPAHAQAAGARRRAPLGRSDRHPLEAEILTAWSSALDGVPGGVADASLASEPPLRRRLSRIMATPGNDLGWVHGRSNARTPERRGDPAEGSPDDEAAASGGSIAAIVYAAAAEFGVDGGMLLTLARCESSLDPDAVSPYGYHGLFQFDEQTWAEYGYGSIYDPVAQARAAARLVAAGQASRWPNCI